MSNLVNFFLNIDLVVTEDHLTVSFHFFFPPVVLGIQDKEKGDFSAFLSG